MFVGGLNLQSHCIMLPVGKESTNKSDKGHEKFDISAHICKLYNSEVLSVYIEKVINFRLHLQKIRQDSIW